MEKDIKEAFKERLGNPFFGYFVFNVVFFNGLEFFYMIASDEPAIGRIKYFTDNTDLGTLVLGPLLVAALIIPAKPYIAAFVKKITKQAELNSLRVDNEKNIEIEKMNAEQAAIQEELIVEQGKTDQKVIEEFSDEHLRKSVMEKLNEARKNSDKDRFNKDVNNVIAATITNSEATIAQLNNDIEYLKKHGGLEDDLLAKTYSIKAHKAIIKALRKSIEIDELERYNEKPIISS